MLHRSGLWHYKFHNRVYIRRYPFKSRQIRTQCLLQSNASWCSINNWIDFWSLYRAQSQEKTIYNLCIYSNSGYDNTDGGLISYGFS
jgi:hypothetical protein